MGFTEGDPLCILRDHDNNILIKTHHINKTRDPKWEIMGDVSFVDCTELKIQILDKDVSTEELMTDVTLTVHKKSLLAPLMTNTPVSGWVPLNSRKAEIRISIHPLLHKAPGSLSVRNTRFPSNRGCRVNLFQSAHIGSERDYLPRVTYYNEFAQRGFGSKRLHPEPTFDFEVDDNAEGPREFVPRNAWEELYVAILQAKYFIYIVGWSVNVEIPLLRERNIVVPGYEHIDGTKIPLGELLDMKAGPNEGVRVLIMTWREATSVSFDMLSHDGVAGTYSEVTKDYFRKRGSNVHIKTLMRASQDAVSLNAVCYTHHQKYVVLDAPALAGSSRPRRVIGFIGGLDLTKGRFDTPKKHLWSTNRTWHAKDFYQNCVPGATQECCRQPWQDIHSKIEGAVARDLITNFEEPRRAIRRRQVHQHHLEGRGLRHGPRPPRGVERAAVQVHRPHIVGEGAGC
eukprot:TRINITY_DN20454_c1_g1_i2.p1 TRINITY_DN20454_c1_g1~~TRINITY_DN20454_c1_g1_i2.p1  ORF type:complete len:509 (+),score=130.33 TRINITY_DN20454_c1_g1_i2:160-1527(+)